MKTNTSLSTVNCHWKKLLKLVSAAFLAAAMLALHPVAAQAATVVATINGGGTANMDDGMGTTHWGAGVKLLSDGSATGPSTALTSTATRRAIRATSGAKLLAGLETPTASSA